jgi:uncharacterized damage-inducible protein DinB
MEKRYRNGAIGAMMDELERATFELLRIVESLQKEDFEKVRDFKTQDENCRSIQTVLSHVVSAGYGYANYIRGSFSLESIPYTKRPLSRDETPARTQEMLDYTAATLKDRWVMSDDEIQSFVIDARWGSRYDIEQLLEHAIVHVLRHRRQIERWLQISKP